jgi:outer membrane lipoprotein
LAVALAACAAGISQQARNLVTYQGSFIDLQHRPTRYIGQTAHLGGKIIETMSDGRMSEVSVLQLPLDWQGRPVDDNRSDGRFIIRSRDFLDPEVFRPGSLLSVVGQVMGSDVRPVGGFSYRYPVILPVEIKHWADTGYVYPAFRIGIGVGGRF